MENKLQQLGLTKIESKVYYTLLGLGPAKATTLITETELHKATVYETLRMLMKKGLVNFTTKEKVKYYEAADPSYLLHLVEEEKEKVREKEGLAASLIKELKKIKESVGRREIVRVYQGKEGAKLVFEDILAYKNYLSFSSQGEMEQVLGSYYYQFQNRKKKLRIKDYVIVSKSDKDKKFVKSIYGRVRLLPVEFFSPTTTIIYGNKVAIFIWAQNPTTILIDNKEIVKNYSNYFRILWKISKPIRNNR